MKQLTISNLTKVIRKKTLLNEINLSLIFGNIYAIIGGNGAGKTTLFRCLLGLSSSIGDIFLDDEPITEERFSDYLKKIGGMFSFPDSYDSLTVKEVLENHIRYYDCPSIDVESYLKKFELSVSLNTKISMFSLGMKQRLNMALAFLHSPEILILDEPFNGLDREGITLLQNLLIEFKQMGKLVIVSSHSFSELESIADNVIMIQNGEIVKKYSFKEMKQLGFEKLEDFYENIKMEGQ